MSIRTLLIWIIIAGTLGGAVIILRARENAALRIAPVVTVRTVGFDPVNAIGIERLVDEDREYLERDPDQADLWILNWSQGGMDHRWAVESTKARSGLRVLATARITLSDEDLVGEIAGSVMVRLRNGGSVRIEFDGDSSGGYSAVRVEERGPDGIATGRWFGRIERSVYNAFIGTGMRHWRSKRIFEMPSSAVRMVELEAGGMSVGLERTGTGWIIVDPIKIQGANEPIEEMMRALISLGAQGFVDEALDDSSTGINTPIATIRMKTTDSTSTLIIGTRSDVEGARVYGQIETPMGSALITLKTDQLSKLTPSVEAYLGKTPSALATTSVLGIQINGRDGRARLIAKRVMGKWAIDERQADSLNREAIERLIGLLMHEPAQIVRMLDPEMIVPAFGSVELLGNGDVVLDQFTIALDSTPSGMRLMIVKELDSGDRVLWATVSDEAAATGAWLTAVAGKRVP